MLKQLLSGTAVAALLVAGPVYAQTDVQVPEQTETQMQDSGATDEAEEDAGAHSDMDAEENLETDAAEGELESDTDAATDTAQDEADTETDTAQDEMESETDTAQDEMDSGTDSEMTADSEADEPAERFFAEQGEEEILATELMNADVQNAEGESLGSINDVLITETEGVKGVVVGVGGFLGLGQKNVAVNYDEIEHQRDESGNVTLVFTVTTEELESAPEFRNLQQQIAEAESEQMQQQSGQPATGTGGSGGMAQ